MAFRILIITDRPFFWGQRTDPEVQNCEHVESVIRILLKNGFLVEVEEIIDCATGFFHRTDGSVFDRVICISERSINGLWSGVEEKIREKMRDWDSIIEYNIGKSDDVTLLEEFGAVIDSRSSSEEDMILQLLKALRESCESSNEERTEMLMRVICNSTEANRSSIIRELGGHMAFSSQLIRLSRIMGEYFDGGEEHRVFVNNDVPEITRALIELFLVETGVTAEQYVGMAKSKSKVDFARKLFLSSTSEFSGNISLRICFGAESWEQIVQIVRRDFANDFELFEHWTKISPSCYDAWEIRSRSLWDNGSREECGKVAEEALVFHPDSEILHRRIAHGHREREDHEKAIEIEELIFENGNLPQLDTSIYLCRSYCAIEDWDNALKYIQIGLDIDPEGEELNRRKNMVTERISGRKD